MSEIIILIFIGLLSGISMGSIGVGGGLIVFILL